MSLHQLHRSLRCLSTLQRSAIAAVSSPSPPSSFIKQQNTSTRLMLRSFATGSRGSRGHGWYVNYRAGKGGRHLQGEYHDRESVEECLAWNQAVLGLGQQQVYLDVVMERRRAETRKETEEKQQQGDNNNSTRNTHTSHHQGTVPSLDSLTGERHRLVLNVATTVMPETTDNFLKLLEEKNKGYTGTLLYRFEKNVGLCGGDVLTNTGKTGQAAEPNCPAVPLARDILEDPLPLWHLPGTITMMVSTVGTVDSRFVLCTQHAPHMDGIHRAFGQLEPDSLQVVQEWQKSLLTQDGIPTSYDLVVVECGVVGEVNSSSPATDSDSAPEPTVVSATA